MKNLQVAWIFMEIADLVDLSGDEAFKAVAYRRAARAIEGLGEDVEKVREEGRLLQIPGVGKGLAGKIEEILASGTCRYLEELRAKVPPGLRQLVRVPGLGPRTAAAIYRELGIKDIPALEKAAKEQRLRGLPGMGAKKEQNILNGIRSLSESGAETRKLLGQVLPDALALRDALRRLPGVEEAELAGSIRRRKEVVGDVDLVASSREPAAVTEFFAHLPGIREVLAHGDTKCSVVMESGLQFDLRAVAPEEFPPALQHFTGSKEHNVRMRGMAKDLGLKINEYGVFREEDGSRLPVRGEEDIFRAVGLSYIPPELREDAGEIEAAAEGRLPRLLELGDIRGDLHCHSKWSDGGNTIEKMAEAARSLGYRYLAITDHSQSLVIAGGLSAERLEEQRREIEALNEKFEDFTILRGIEVDILKDGSLDLPDEVLEGLDFVTASIHSGFRQDGETLTNRVLQAMKNPHVDSIGHPTGRLLGRRDPYPIDVDRIIEAAGRTGTALELNASPDRLDLDDRNLRKAKEAGVKIVINSDAHSVETLRDMPYGVGQARRGWLEAGDVLNTMDLDDLIKYLKG